MTGIFLKFLIVHFLTIRVVQVIGEELYKLSYKCLLQKGKHNVLNLLLKVAVEVHSLFWGRSNHDNKVVQWLSEWLFSINTVITSVNSSTIQTNARIFDVDLIAKFDLSTALVLFFFPFFCILWAR